MINTWNRMPVLFSLFQLFPVSGSWRWNWLMIGKKTIHWWIIFLWALFIGDQRWINHEFAIRTFSWSHLNGREKQAVAHCWFQRLISWMSLVNWIYLLQTRDHQWVMKSMNSGFSSLDTSIKRRNRRNQLSELTSCPIFLTLMLAECHFVVY